VDALGAHRVWWQNFLRDSGGTGFWHEAYFMRGGMEGIYNDVKRPLGFQAFAASAHGAAFSARKRLGIAGDAPAEPEGVSEQESY
jgi:hypothetical protein